MKPIMLSLLSAGLLLSSCGRHDIASSKVPSVVLNTLKAKYPVTIEADWEKHGDLYEAELDINDSIEISVQIDETGRLIMQKEDVAENVLTPGIITVLNTQYKGYTIDDIERIEKNGAVYFQVELNRKKNKEVNLIFSTDGKEEKSIPYWD